MLAKTNWPMKLSCSDGKSRGKPAVPRIECSSLSPQMNVRTYNRAKHTTTCGCGGIIPYKPSDWARRGDGRPRYRRSFSPVPVDKILVLNRFGKMAQVTNGRRNAQLDRIEGMKNRFQGTGTRLIGTWQSYSSRLLSYLAAVFGYTIDKQEFSGHRSKNENRQLVLYSGPSPRFAGRFLWLGRGEGKSRRRAVWSFEKRGPDCRKRTLLDALATP